MKRNGWLRVAVLAGALAGIAWGGDGDATRCKWCGSGGRGPGCPYSPVSKHEHRGDGGRCEWCGSAGYGPGCPYSPTGKHRHGPGDGCIWCKSGGYGPGCPHSPTGKHER